MATVRVLKQGTNTREVEVEPGATIQDALAAAQLDRSGFRVLLNGEEASPTVQIGEEDTIQLVPKIEGGN